ncbi:MAG: tryptophan--tRNA ligase [Desulfatiglandales bacterium]
MKKVILSGMRPTGIMHVGHLYGALMNWAGFQDTYTCYYFIADWHALTTEYEDPSVIRESKIDMIIDWMAAGLDPGRCTFFVQSQIKEHAELHLLLSMIVPLPWLERNPTYKEQLRELKTRDLYTYGFLGYPVLQAADILIYKAHGVPVGEDQAAHVELTREIARRFNYLYGEVFPIPEVLLTKTSKLLGIDRRKMSKSLNNAIFLRDAPETIRSKVSIMITDPQRARRSDPGDPSVCNVYSFHELYTPYVKVVEIGEACRTAKIGCVECKGIMAQNLIEGLAPIREKALELESKKGEIEEILQEGNRRAREVAQRTMEEVRAKLNL